MSKRIIVGERHTRTSSIYTLPTLLRVASTSESCELAGLFQRLTAEMNSFEKQKQKQQKKKTDKSYVNLLFP